MSHCLIYVLIYGYRSQCQRDSVQYAQCKKRCVLLIKCGVFSVEVRTRKNRRVGHALWGQTMASSRELLSIYDVAVRGIIVIQNISVVYIACTRLLTRTDGISCGQFFVSSFYVQCYIILQNQKETRTATVWIQCLLLLGYINNIMYMCTNTL